MKSVIADTFSQMLDKEDIDKITVTKLIAECHISRQTFYYHFKDIMDVLEWTFRRATRELVEQSLGTEDRIKSLTAYVTFVRQNRAKLEKLLYSRRWVQIEGMLVEAVTIYLAEIARNKVPDLDPLLRIEPCRRLIQDDDPGIPQQRLRDEHTLLHAS